MKKYLHGKTMSSGVRPGPDSVEVEGEEEIARTKNRQEEKTRKEKVIMMILFETSFPHQLIDDQLPCGRHFLNSQFLRSNCLASLCTPAPGRETHD
jgi:hypothetical protein